MGAHGSSTSTMGSRKMGTPRFVIVKWLDAQADLGWKDAGEEKTPNPHVFSVGWIVESTKDAIVLAADIGPDASTNRRLEVPRGMLRGIEDLTTKRRAKVAKKPKKKAKKVKVKK